MTAEVPNRDMLAVTMLALYPNLEHFYQPELYFASLMAPTVAFGPPYDTDDPEPVEYRHWETYISSFYFHTHDGTSGTGPHLEVNYGVLPNVQLHVIAPMAYSDPTGSPSNYGYGDTELGVKYRFVQESKKVPMVGIFPLIEVPTGAASRGLGNGQAQFFLPIWFQKSIGQWSSYAGGGFWRNPGAGNHDYWFFGWQAQNQVTKKLSLGGELYHATSSAIGMPERNGFNLGAVYDLDEGHHLMASIGKDFRGPNHTAAYLAYQWTFGPKEKTEEKSTSGS